VDEIRLADDPADARGVLSHHHGVDPGAYGFLTEIAIDKTLLEAALEGRAPLRIRFEVSDRNTHPGGFALYGDRLGCIPMAPTLFLLTG
jgi:predicted transcriptional regulator